MRSFSPGAVATIAVWKSAAHMSNINAMPQLVISSSGRCCPSRPSPVGNYSGRTKPTMRLLGATTATSVGLGYGRSSNKSI